MVAEAQKSHHLLSASWRSGRGGGIQSTSEGLRIRGADGVNPSLSPEGLRTRSPDFQGQEKMDVPAQEENEFALPHLFVHLHSQRWNDALAPWQ